MTVDSSSAWPPRQPIRVADALAAGITDRQLRNPDLCAPVRGVRTETLPMTYAAGCAAVLLAIPGDIAFSHISAAHLHGLPMSRLMEADDDVHVLQVGSDQWVRRPNVRGHRGKGVREIVDVQGLPVTCMADTWVDMGELVGLGKPVGLDDLVVMGDAIATRLGSVERLRSALEKRVRPRGKLTLLEALEFIRVGSESPGETRTRLVLVRAGLPEPQLNRPIYARDGRWLGRPDLRYRRRKVVIEYQGEEFHRGDEAEAEDEARFDGFRSEDWRVVAVWADDINSDESRESLVRTVARYLDYPESKLSLSDCGPRFFSRRMLELAEIRARRRRAERLSRRA